MIIFIVTKQKASAVKTGKFKIALCKHSYVITSERRNICTHEDMYELTCIKCGKTMSINLADPNYINKND